MRTFQNTSIRRKQTLIIMLTSSVVLLLACAAFTIYEVITFRKDIVQQLSTLAEIVGNNTSAALDYNDSKSAIETLSALQAESGIIGACIYRKDGEVFAKYDRAHDEITFAPPAVQAERHIFERQRLVVSRPISYKGETIGEIYLESDMSALSSRLWRYAGIVALVFLASLVLALALSNQLQRLVSDPILQLARVVRSVALEKDYSVRATKRGNDELGQLVDGFNEMLAQIQTRDSRADERTRELEDIHKQLVEASRRGGMAEIATNVLHNVGNVLNSVNLSASIVADSVRKSRTSSLAQVVSLLREHEHDLGTFITSDPKGKQLPQYLGQLSEHLLADQKATVQELDSLRTNVEHIKEIVAMQQSYATFGGVKEMIDVQNLVEDGMRMNEGALSRHRVKIIREFGTVPPLNLEKHKMLQILVNLLRNAKHACQDSDRPDKQITVRIINGDGRVRISVIDNGIGIPSENLTRIFNHGFTTRKDGHGFGLHSGALAAKEMGGSLTVQSDGPGKGAVFTLELPIEQKSNAVGR